MLNSSQTFRKYFCPPLFSELECCAVGLQWKVTTRKKCKNCIEYICSVCQCVLCFMKVVLMIHDWFIVLVFSEEDNNFKEVG